MTGDTTVRILFLGGAKRVSMARLFEEAAERAGLTSRIYGYELSGQCPLAAVAAEIVEGPRWSDPDILKHLDATVLRLGIDIIIPFVDGAVAVASSYVAAYPERHVFTPAAEPLLAELMFDKVASADLFERLGLPIPATWHPGDPCLRLIAKPRHGSASKGIVVVNSLQRLDEIGSLNDYLVQERIDEREEITVDCYVSMHSGRIEGVSPRLRLETAGGEAVRTITIACPKAEELARRTLEATGLRGAVTIQLIRDLETDRYMIMEINPRLGGGAVASVHAGFHLPAAILADARQNVDFQIGTPTPGVLVTRYLDDVVFYPNE